MTADQVVGARLVLIHAIGWWRLIKVVPPQGKTAGEVVVDMGNALVRFPLRCVDAVTL